jgi:hypothetical protein
VAGLIARRMRRQDTRDALAVVEALKREARHVGQSIPDPAYGYGLLKD